MSRWTIKNCRITHWAWLATGFSHISSVILSIRLKLQIASLRFPTSSPRQMDWVEEEFCGIKYIQEIVFKSDHFEIKEIYIPFWGLNFNYISPIKDIFNVSKRTCAHTGTNVFKKIINTVRTFFLLLLRGDNNSDVYIVESTKKTRQQFLFADTYDGILLRSSQSYDLHN